MKNKILKTKEPGYSKKIRSETEKVFGNAMPPKYSSKAKSYKTSY